MVNLVNLLPVFQGVSSIVGSFVPVVDPVNAFIVVDVNDGIVADVRLADVEVSVLMLLVVEVNDGIVADVRLADVDDKVAILAVVDVKDPIVDDVDVEEVEVNV
jgi:hypothetical protein